MKIIVNGEEKNLKTQISAAELLESYNLNPEYTVVEIGSVIIKKEELSKYIIKENDKIELIRFMGGG